MIYFIKVEIEIIDQFSRLFILHIDVVNIASNLKMLKEKEFVTVCKISSYPLGY